MGLAMACLQLPLHLNMICVNVDSVLFYRLEENCHCNEAFQP